MKTQILTGVTLSLMLAACAHTPKWEDTGPEEAAPPPAPVTQPFRQMSADALKIRLGKPDFVHTETQSQIWRYDLKQCRVLFYLYTDNGQLTVHQYQSLPNGKPGELSQTCRDALNARAG